MSDHQPDPWGEQPNRDDNTMVLSDDADEPKENRARADSTDGAIEPPEEDLNKVSDKDEPGQVPAPNTRTRRGTLQERKDNRGDNIVDKTAALKSKIQRLEAEKKNLKANNEQLTKVNSALSKETILLRNTSADLLKKNVRLEAKVTELETFKANLEVEKNELTEEIVKVNQLLEDKETDMQELLQQLDTSSGLSPSSSFSQPLLAGLIIYDNVMAPVIEQVKAADLNTRWSCLEAKVSDNLEEVDADDYDIILLLIGSQDAREGMAGHMIYKKLATLADRFATVPRLAIAELVPSSVKGSSGHISIANYKLDKLKESDVKIIQFRLKDMPKDKILDAMDALTPAAREQIVKSIRDQIGELPSPKQQRKKSRKEEDNTNLKNVGKFSAMLTLGENDVGRVIGKSGSVISKLSKENDVVLTIGQWYEPKRENRKEYEFKTDAVLVSGSVNNINKATKLISDIKLSKNKNDA